MLLDKVIAATPLIARRRDFVSSAEECVKARKLVRKRKYHHDRGHLAAIPV
jgi:hypothetical protein